MADYSDICFMDRLKAADAGQSAEATKVLRVDETHLYLPSRMGV
jgi:hypothetical protein